MKVRMDFVTNSSSSSFLIGRKNNGALTAEGKEKLANLVMECIGISEKASPLEADDIDDCGFYDDGERDDIKTAERGGFEVIKGYVSYEEADYHLAQLAGEILEILKKEPNYKVFPYDLTY